MNIDAYAKPIVIQGYECDPNNRMGLGAVLRRAQQIAVEQCAGLGMTEALYAKTHTAFLMAKLTAEFYQPMQADQQLVLTTQPSAPQRAVYHRYTTFCTPQGELLCAIDSRWILIDTRTKKILRRAPEELHPPFTQQPVKDLDMHLCKTAVSPIAEETASYTRCDHNRHLNNTYYADILCDHIPTVELDASIPRRLAIVYHQEVPMGSRFTLSCGAIDHGYYFIGASNGKTHFEANLTF